MAAMAFYAYRDLNRTEAEPFLLAAFERNPVSIEATKDMSVDELAGTVASLPDASIYDEPGRLAQPDEVWNYKRGDGVEKALLLANVLRAREPDAEISLSITDQDVTVKAHAFTRGFTTAKGLKNQTWSPPAD